MRRWALLALLAACGGPQQLGGAGAKCFRDDDCQAGLICVAPSASDSRRVCSGDATPIVSRVSGPEPVATGGAAGAVTAGMNAGGAELGGSANAGSSSGGEMTNGGGAGAAGRSGGTNAGGSSTGGADAGGTSSGGTDAGGTATDGGAAP